ncbi:MAG: hypothetical protein ACR2KV_13640 [Solirubrobacteraceae bacterium]
MAQSKAGLAVALGAGVVLGKAIGTEQTAFARLSGWTIAGPDAAGWVTDFLNAAYYRREPDERDLDELRLAFSIVTTYWAAKRGRKLRVFDVLPFHRAFFRARYARGESSRGTLSGDQLRDGAARLLGDWFLDAYADDGRRAYGIAFRTPEGRERFRPETRLELAGVGELTPGASPGEAQTWHTYSPVEVSCAERVVDALLATETWPDYATEVGRFTPLRTSPLLGQTFEIEVAAGTESGRPMFQRGYVTITELVTRDDEPALERYFEDLEHGLAEFGYDEPRAVPAGGEPILGFDLTTHKGHFMGRGKNRLIAYRHDGRDYLRAAGTWDPMPWHVATAYELAGRESQHTFWGEGAIESRSLLHQLAGQTA